MSSTILQFPAPAAEWHVKIVRYGESFWVKASGELHGTITGTVANNVGDGLLNVGDPICFQHSEAVDEINKPAWLKKARNDTAPTNDNPVATTTPQDGKDGATPQPQQDKGP